jgi:hypothetical protein
VGAVKSEYSGDAFILQVKQHFFYDKWFIRVSYSCWGGLTFIFISELSVTSTIKVKLFKALSGLQPFIGSWVGLGQA